MQRTSGEMTRVCVDKAVDPGIRKIILPELLAATKEFFDELGVVGMVGVTRAHLLSHFIRRGVVSLGEPAIIEGETERAFFVPTRDVRPTHHCEKYSVPQSVLVRPASAILRNVA